MLFVLTSRTPGGAPSDGDRWLPVADLDALDEPVEVVSVLREVLAEHTGRRPGAARQAGLVRAGLARRGRRLGARAVWPASGANLPGQRRC